MSYIQRNLVPLVVGLVAIAAILVSTAVIVDRVRFDHHDRGRFSDARFQRDFGGAQGGATLGVQVDDSLKVTSVVSGSAAEQAGVKTGDQLLAINGHDVKTLDDVRSQLRAVQADSDYTLKVSRDGKAVDLKAHKGAAQAASPAPGQPRAPQGPGAGPQMPPGPGPQTPQGPRLGIAVAQVPTGVRVLTVEAGSAAETAGVKPEDIITAANGQATPTIEALQNVVQAAGAGGTVTLTATRGGATVTLTARLGRGTSAGSGPARRPSA